VRGPPSTGARAEHVKPAMHLLPAQLRPYRPYKEKAGARREGREKGKEYVDLPTRNKRKPQRNLTMSFAPSLPGGRK